MDKKKLALIHIIKKELKLTDVEYKRILREATGVNSAKYLNEEKFKKLMNYFVRSKHYKINPYGLTIKQKLYIKHFAQLLAWSSDHLNNFIHKYYHKPDIDKLTKEEAIKVIESLKNVFQHQKQDYIFTTAIILFYIPGSCYNYFDEKEMYKQEHILVKLLG